MIAQLQAQCDEQSIVMNQMEKSTATLKATRNKLMLDGAPDKEVARAQKAFTDSELSLARQEKKVTGLRNQIDDLRRKEDVMKDAALKVKVAEVDVQNGEVAAVIQKKLVDAAKKQDKAEEIMDELSDEQREIEKRAAARRRKAEEKEAEELAEARRLEAEIAANARADLAREMQEEALREQRRVADTAALQRLAGANAARPQAAAMPDAPDAVMDPAVAAANAARQAQRLGISM